MAANTAFEVGKYYRVPCVDAFVHNKRGRYAVYGPWHEDGDYIGFPHHHYHLDLRFSPTWIMKQYMHPAAVAVESVFGPPILRRRKMLRAMPVFPFMRERLNGSSYPTFERLSYAYSDSEFGPHKQCPHKGASLAGIPSINGVIVCPLHGLCFDERTGKAMEPFSASRRIKAAACGVQAGEA